MILSCNSCEKKFVVPDDAIKASGRMVQCGSCGNQWKQFPLKGSNFKKSPVKLDKKIEKPKIQKSKKRKSKKSSCPNLYSPEYLAKKHGIKLNDKSEKKPKKIPAKSKSNLGFYNSSFVFALNILIFFWNI